MKLKVCWILLLIVLLSYSVSAQCSIESLSEDCAVGEKCCMPNAYTVGECVDGDVNCYNQDYHLESLENGDTRRCIDYKEAPCEICPSDFACCSYVYQQSGGLAGLSYHSACVHESLVNNNEFVECSSLCAPEVEPEDADDVCDKCLPGYVCCIVDPPNMQPFAVYEPHHPDKEYNGCDELDPDNFKHYSGYQVCDASCDACGGCKPPLSGWIAEDEDEFVCVQFKDSGPSCLPSIYYSHYEDFDDLLEKYNSMIDDDAKKIVGVSNLCGTDKPVYGSDPCHIMYKQDVPKLCVGCMYDEEGELVWGGETPPVCVTRKISSGVTKNFCEPIDDYVKYDDWQDFQANKPDDVVDVSNICAKGDLSPFSQPLSQSAAPEFPPYFGVVALLAAILAGLLISKQNN